MGKLLSNAVNTFSIGTETTLNSPVIPTEILKHTGFSGGFKYDSVESASFNGSRAPNGVFRTSGIGNLELPVEADSANLGWLLAGVFGSETVSAIGGGEYRHTYTMNNNPNGFPSFTIENQIDGYKVFYRSGAILNSLSIEASPKSIIKATGSYFFMSETDQKKTATFTNGTATINVNAHGFVANDLVRFYKSAPTSVLPVGITEGKDYYVISTGLTTNAFKVSATNGGASITFSTDGTGTIEVSKFASLTATSQRPMLFTDGTLKINSASIGEIKNINLNLENNVFTDDFRLGNTTGSPSSLPVGKFKASGKMTAVLNSDSYFLKDIFTTNTSFALDFILDTGITLGSNTYKVSFSIPTAYFSNVEFGGGDFGEISFDFVASGSNPMSAILANNKASTYI